VLRGLVPLVLVIAAACGSAEGPYDYEKTGLTELVLTFGGAARPEPSVLKATLVELGQRDIQIVRMDDFRRDGVVRPALRVQFALSEWPTPTVREGVAAEIRQVYGAAMQKVAWSGERIFARSTAPVAESRLRDIVTQHGLVVREIRIDQDEGTFEYLIQVRVGGIDAEVERALEAKLPGTDVIVESALSVGPRRPH
jgi:hypothetical protein